MLSSQYVHPVPAEQPVVGLYGDDVVAQPPHGVHEATRAKNWLKVSGLVTQVEPSCVETCPGCDVMRKPRYGLQPPPSEPADKRRHECPTKSVNDIPARTVERSERNVPQLIKFSQWSKYFRTACAKKVSVCRADEASTIVEWTGRNGDDYLDKDEWAGRAAPWRVMRDNLTGGWRAVCELYDTMFRTMAVMCEDAGDAGTREVGHCVCTQFISGSFKEGTQGYVPGATQSNGSAAARLIRFACGDVDAEALVTEDGMLLENAMLRALHSADLDLDALSLRLEEISDVRIDLVAIETGIAACRRHFIDGMDSLPSLPLAYSCRANTLDILLARGMDWHSMPYLASAHSVVLDEMFSDTLQTIAITSDAFDACFDTSNGNALNAVRALWTRIGGSDNERAYRLLAVCGRAFARSHTYVMHYGRADCALGCAAIAYDCMMRRLRPTWSSLEAILGFEWHNEFRLWWSEYTTWAATNSAMGGTDVATDLEADGRCTGGDKWVLRGANRTATAIQGQWRKPGVSARLHAELVSGRSGWGARMDEYVTEFVEAAHANWETGSGLDLGRWSGDIGLSVAVFAITKLLQV